MGVAHRKLAYPIIRINNIEMLHVGMYNIHCTMGDKLTINKEYAAKYTKKKQAEELSRRKLNP